MKDYKAIITAIYSQYNNSKLAEIDTLLAKYKGQEDLLLQRLIIKYKINPNEIYNELQYVNQIQESETDIEQPPQDDTISKNSENNSVQNLMIVIALLVVIVLLILYANNNASHN